MLVVLLLHIHMWGSTGVHRLWARPCFSSSVPRWNLRNHIYLSIYLSLSLYIYIYRERERERERERVIWYRPVSWGCKIQQLHLCKIRPTTNECPVYDSKQSDGEHPVMLQLWGMWSTPSLSSLLYPLWPGVVTLVRVLSMSQKELNCVLMLNWIAWNRTIFVCETELFQIGLFWYLTVCKKLYLYKNELFELEPFD